MNLPNKITVSRIIAIVLMDIAFFVMAFIPFTAPDLGDSKINLVYFIICILFILAAFTDMADGKIARKFNLVTDFGKFLDPIADKLLNDSLMLFLLVPQLYAPNQRSDSKMLTILLFCVIVMIARDLCVDGIRLVAAKKNVVIAANYYGKVKTVLQMIAIPMLLLNDWPFSYFDSNWPQALQISNIIFYLATIMSVVSCIMYIVQNRKVLFGSK